jgi:hypothetical protein
VAQGSGGAALHLAFPPSNRGESRQWLARGQFDAATITATTTRANARESRPQARRFCLGVPYENTRNKGATTGGWSPPHFGFGGDAGHASGGGRYLPRLVVDCLDFGFRRRWPDEPTEGTLAKRAVRA